MFSEKKNLLNHTVNAPNSGEMIHEITGNFGVSIDEITGNFGVREW